MEKQTYSISRRCSEVTLDDFIACVCEGDLTRLVKGHAEVMPKNEALAAAFEELYSEYSDMLGNDKYSYTVDLMRKCARMEAKIRAAVLALQAGDVEMLKRAGYKLANVEAEMNEDGFLLEVWQAELAVLQQKENGKKQERKDFLQWVAAVAHAMGFKIGIKDTMLDEFIACHTQANELAKATARAKAK